MKKLILILCVVVGAIQLTAAQSVSGYGIKGGLNYGSNGNLISETGNIISHPDENVGFNLGVYAKFGGWIYFKPELLYTNTSSGYNNFNGGDATFKTQKIELPTMVGLRLIGPLSIFAGPSFQYILSSELDGKEASDVDKSITMGYNIGLAVSFKRFAIDLRYEGAFSNNQTDFLNANGLEIATVDSRPEQLILNLSIKI
ncbi:outer membrane beta-barrel protein [Formosa sp. PL04]|uniref:outer membrane beta-barrel protein n=1 Tax=Formosa sp. PL04 TaxID=3081755 RepID=UPI002981C3B5|nr:outer membrane beta-barrel protein [Formosa sp. PL04]MDW5290954.1 outer membrane beta-barrel protein [Formosa sp. PL04]